MFVITIEKLINPVQLFHHHHNVIILLLICGIKIMSQKDCDQKRNMPTCILKII